MIQRVQTIYLLLAFTCSVLLLFLPIYHLSGISANGNDAIVLTLGAYGIQGETSKTMPLYLIFVLSSMLSVLAIFLYKNRGRQLLVCRLNLIFQVLIALSFLLVSFFGLDYISSQYNDLGYVIDKVKLSYGTGYYFLFFGIPFLLLAIRGIRKDEALLKSLDRLR